MRAIIIAVSIGSSSSSSSSSSSRAVAAVAAVGAALQLKNSRLCKRITANASL